MNITLRLAILVLLYSSTICAQCPAFQDCPSSEISVCDLSLNNPDLWNHSSFWDAVDSSHNLPESELFLIVKAINGCTGGAPDSIRFVLFLDLDGDGTTETAVSSENLLPEGKIMFHNADSVNYISHDTIRFDDRPVAADQKWRFVLHKTLNGDILTARIRWNTAAEPNAFFNPELPAGTHHITWTVQQGGATATCTETIVVRDCKNPVITCKNGLSVNILGNGSVDLLATDFLQSTDDNYTPSGQIQLGIRRSGAGSGFPLNAKGQPNPNVVYTCNDLGTQLIELWARDHAGNVDYCETYVIVQDNAGNCTQNPNGEFCILVACDTSKLSGVNISITGSGSPGLPPFSFFDLLNDADQDGCPEWDYNQVPIGANITATLQKDNDPLNGVSTFDLILINKHILGQAIFDKPWQFIAADVNDSRSITTFDIVELRKLILGIYAELPNNTSWRFYPATYVFPTPNPLQYIVPNSLPGTQLSDGFNAVKVGDLNCTAIPNFRDDPPDDRFATLVAFPDISLAAGETADLPLQVPVSDAWQGFQFALGLDPDLIEIEQVTPGNLPAINEQSFAQPRPGVLTASWFDAAPPRIAAGETLVTLRVRARAALRLRDAVHLLPQQLHAEVYTAGEQTEPLQLTFADPRESLAVTTIFPAQPNPTAGAARIPVRMSEPGTVLLEVTDLTGRVLYQSKSEQETGLYWIDIPAQALPEVGVYGWRVQAGSVQGVGKLVRN